MPAVNGMTCSIDSHEFFDEQGCTSKSSISTSVQVIPDDGLGLNKFGFQLTQDELRLDTSSEAGFVMHVKGTTMGGISICQKLQVLVCPPPTPL